MSFSLKNCSFTFIKLSFNLSSFNTIGKSINHLLINSQAWWTFKSVSYTHLGTMQHSISLSLIIDLPFFSILNAWIKRSRIKYSFSSNLDLTISSPNLLYEFIKSVALPLLFDKDVYKRQTPNLLITSQLLYQLS